MTEQLKRHMVRSRDMHEWNYTCPDEKYACSEVVLYSDHAAAVASLEAQIAQERAYSKRAFDTAIAERDAALARLAEVERDAARYRWLRDEADASTVEHMWHTTAVADTDAAIDAQLAISQEKRGDE